MNVPVPPKAGLSAVEALRQSLQVLPPQKTHDYGVIGDKPVSTPATQLTQASHSAEKHVQEPRDALMQLALHQSITPAELAKILKGDSAAVGMPIPSRPTIEAPARGNESRVGGDISRDMGMARLQASLPLSIREEEESLSRGDSKVYELPSSFNKMKLIANARPASGLPETPTKECPIRNRGVTFSNVLVRAQRPKRRSLNPNFKRTDQGPNVSVADVYPEDSPHHQASKEKTLKVDVSEQWLTPAEAEGRRQGATAPPAPILSGAWRQGPPIQRSSRRAGAQDGSPVLRRGCGASAQDQEAAAFQRQIEEHNQRMVQATMPVCIPALTHEDELTSIQNPDLPASQLLSTEQAAQAYKEHLAARFSWIQEQQQQLPGRQDQRPMLLPEELVSTEQRPFQSRNERLLTRPEHATQQHNPTRVRAEPMLQQPAHENVQGQLTLVSLETLCNHPAVANHPLFKSIDINALHEAEQNAPPSPPMSAVVSLGRYDPLQCERRRLSPSQLDGSRYGVKIAIGTEWNPPVPK